MSRFLGHTFVPALLITAIVVILVVAIPRLSLIGPGESQESLVCSRIQGSTDRTVYANGSTGIIQVEYTHLLPGCVEALIFHVHTIVVDANGVLLDRWNTTGNSVRDIRWVSSSGGSLGTSVVIRACEGGLAFCSSTDVVVTSRPFAQIIPPPSAGLEIVTVATVSLIVGLGVGLVFRNSAEIKKIVSLPGSGVLSTTRFLGVPFSDDSFDVVDYGF